MRTAWYAFYYSVVVRRVGTGSTPFRWEVQAADGICRRRSRLNGSGACRRLRSRTNLAGGILPALPLPRIARSTTLSTDDDRALPNEDKDIDPALDALDEGFIGTAAPVCPPSIG